MKNWMSFGAGAIAATLLLSNPVRAEHEVSGHGFIVTNKTVAAASPADVWTVLTQPSRYWNPDHGYSGKAENYTMDGKAGGCFCEALPDGGSVEHMRVVMVAPGKMLRLSGALGPLQAEGLAGALTWMLTARGDGGTDIEQMYVVGGQMRFPAAQIAPAVESVLQEQLDRLAAAATAMHGETQ